MFFLTGPAPRAVMVARVVAPVVLIFAYVAFRAVPAVDGRIPWFEVLSAGVAIAGLSIVTALALVDLALRPAIERVENALEITAAQQPVWDIDELIGYHREQFLTLVDQGELAEGWSDAVKAAFPTLREEPEPNLITHEFEALHHTPPRGFRLDIADPPLPGRMKIAHPPLIQTARTSTITGR